MIVEIKGDILDTDCKLIAHGVNCQGVMGSGVAKVLLEKFSILRPSYFRYVNNKKSEGWEPSDLLGSVQYVGVTHDTVIANCFTQQNFGPGDQVYFNYDAFRHCIVDLVTHMHHNNLTEIAMPKIGCGLAGGDWNKVKEILKIFFNEGNPLTVKVYSL